MNRIDARFQALSQAQETAFIAYITAGDPTLDCTEELVMKLEEAGVDIIELGVPFSDPVADGVANQEGAQRALKHNVSLHDIVARIKTLRERTQIPLVLFTYFNPVLSYGLASFAADAADSGVDGVLCVDLPPEEAEEHMQRLHGHDIATVFLAAPTSTARRLEIISQASTGFVYYVSRTGVTGERADVEASVRERVAEIKGLTDKPVVVGFGISNPEQAAEVAGYCDGVVVGSAIVRMVGELGESPDMPARVGDFVRSLADATKGKGSA